MADSAAPNGNPNVEALKANAAAAYETVTNGPLAQNVKAQSAMANEELSRLAASRRTPPYKTATGQTLTHYHSFFLELLSWNSPRASALAYLTIVSLIFTVRYLDVLRWAFKLTWMVLGITVAAEAAGKSLLGNGLATQIRPRKYFTVSRETLDALIGDVHELVNFFVIESQRVLFAENVYVSAAAALAAFISYYLVKIVPYWGLAVIATTVTFFAPLIYKTNQEFIDEQLRHAGELVGAQTAQLRSVAQKHTAHASQVTKQYMGDYTAKAQALIKNAGARAHHEQQVLQNKLASVGLGAGARGKAPLKPEDFPAAPSDELKRAVDADAEPVAPAAPVDADATKEKPEEPLVAA
ncbi:hypothetical protein VTK26DRAFT_6859 [Humicola hyalothermophila]